MRAVIKTGKNANTCTTNFQNSARRRVRLKSALHFTWVGLKWIKRVWLKTGGHRLPELPWVSQLLQHGANLKYEKYIICYSLAERSVLGETVLDRGLGTQTVGTVSTNTDRPRPVNNILFLSYWDLKVSGKFSFTLQPMCVEVGCVGVDKTRDRL